MRTALRALLCVSTTKFKKGTRSGRRRSGAKRSGGRPNEGTQFALSTQRAHSNVQRNGQLFCGYDTTRNEHGHPQRQNCIENPRNILDPLRVFFVGFCRVLGVGFWWFSMYRNVKNPIYKCPLYRNVQSGGWRPKAPSPLCARIR